MTTTIVNPVSAGQAYQVQLASAPQSGQYNYRQLWSRILQYNPDIPVTLAKQWVNDAYRRVIDYRQWYGLMAKGVLNAPGAYTTGNVTCTQGSTTVQGNGTSWTTAMVGLQFRTGYQNPIYTITSVDQTAQTLTIDLPWGNPTLGNQGYMIVMEIVDLGPMVKRVLWMVNQQNGYMVEVNVPQEYINARDAWRSNFGWTYWLGQYPPAPNGDPLWELYPAPNVTQTFPFCVYNQPPDMVNDTDYPVSFVRGDIVAAAALSVALRYRGRGQSYTDPVQADYFEKQFQSELEKMATNDDNQYLQDFQYRPDAFGAGSYGANFWQSHAPFYGGDY